MNPLRLSGILVLTVLCLSLVSPLTVHLVRLPADTGAHLVTLNVCNVSDASLSVNADSPSLYECSCKHMPLQFAGYHELPDAAFVPFIFSLRHERPPRV